MKMIVAVVSFLVAAMMSPPAPAQQGPFPTAGASSPDATQAELDALLAPIALYPDSLLSQVLAASTYPLEVVALQRWLERNPNIPDASLEQALAAQPWDESVKALAQFRSVVAMMNGELDWMQRLGNAFLGNEAQVMDTVQGLRRKAREAGSLADNARERVVVDNDAIAIEPIQPDVVYVPVYDPLAVYGPWWWPAYPPYVWSTAYFGPWDFVAGGIAFGIGVHVGGGWFRHPYADWHNHNLLVRRPGAVGPWSHDPIHRGGVAYPDPRTRDRFGAVDRDRVRSRQDFRGFDVHAPPSTSSRVSPANPVARPSGASPLSPQSRDATRQHSERGRASLGSARPAPSGRASPGSARPAPTGRARGKP
jgi:hypothetical protein